MPKSDSEHRIGLYECQISSDRHILPGNSLKTLYYERFTQDFVKARIMPDLHNMKRQGAVFQYPILVKSWRLYLEHSVPSHGGPYDNELKGKSSLKEIREQLGMSAQREKVPGSETYRVVIDEHGNIFPVDPTTNTI